MSSFASLRLLLSRFQDKGLVYVIGKVLLTSIIRPLRSRYHFWRYHNDYPVNLIFIAGLGKGGSTWFARMFASLPGFEVLTPLPWKVARAEAWNDFGSTNLFPGVFDEFTGKLAVVKHHTWGFPENAAILRELGIKYLITVRDPRDALISNYYYALNHPENWDHENAAGRSIEEYLTEKLASGDFNRQFLDWCRSWTTNRDPEKSLILRYEDALEDASSVMRRAFEFLDFKVSDEMIRRIAEENRFEKYAGRKQGSENTASFFRKGIAGEWETTFTEAHRNAFAVQGEDVIRALEYKATFSG